MKRRKLLIGGALGLGGIVGGAAAASSRVNVTETVRSVVDPPEQFPIETGTTIIDDCAWTNPSESPFDWEFTLDESADIMTNPDDGHLTFAVEENDHTARMEMGGDQALNLDDYADYRLDVVESSTQSQVGSAWEFFFVSDGTDTPWVLIDAGGGDDVSTTETEDDASGDGFYVRRDQLLTRYRENGEGRYSWDEFEDTPIDHSSPRRLSLEILGSESVVNGYVDGELQASLRADDDQYVLNSGYVRPMMKLHSRGDEDERGFVHRVALTKLER